MRAHLSAEIERLNESPTSAARDAESRIGMKPRVQRITGRRRSPNDVETAANDIFQCMNTGVGSADLRLVLWSVIKGNDVKGAFRRIAHFRLES